MRGKPPVHRDERVADRIIPAHAGQTTSPHRRPRTWTDHPRTCGANNGEMADLSIDSGSSPHMRGKPGRAYRARDHRRIIPAHAGQTSPATSPCTARTDHPRTCGANSTSSTFAVYVIGSSPHMRGKLVSPCPTSVSQRIIPAHAGQTKTARLEEPCRSDHPRTCGANHQFIPLRYCGAGSSPHMRGKRVVYGWFPRR